MIIIYLALISALGPLAIDSYLPSMTAIQNEFGVDYSQVQMTLNAFLVSFSIMQLVWGPVSDRFGRKPVLLGCAIVFTLMSLLIIFSPSINFLIVARLIQGAAASAMTIIALAIARDRWEDPLRTKNIALVMSFVTASPVVAPLIGGVIEHYFTWRDNFIFLAIMGSLSILAICFKITETNLHKTTHLNIIAISKDYATVFKNKHFLTMAFGVLMIFTPLASYILNSPNLLMNLHHLSPLMFGLVFGFNALSITFASILVSRLVSRYSPIRVAKAGASIALTGGALMLVGELIFGTTLWILILPMLAVSAGTLLALSPMISSSLNPFSTLAGTASSAVNTFRYFIGTILVYFIGLLLSHHYYAQSLSSIIGAGITLCLLKRAQPAQNER